MIDQKNTLDIQLFIEKLEYLIVHNENIDILDEWQHILIEMTKDEQNDVLQFAKYFFRGIYSY